MDEVLKIAKLARLHLTDAELSLYQERLSRVLEHVKELESVSVNNQSYFHWIPSDSQSQREDAGQAFSTVSSLMENAPAKEDNQYLLPTVIEQDV